MLPCCCGEKGRIQIGTLNGDSIWQIRLSARKGEFGEGVWNLKIKLDAWTAHWLKG